MTVYSIFGYGKMKTESAIGMAVRAVQNKEEVVFAQFLKDGSSSEIRFFEAVPGVTCMYNPDIGKITLPGNTTKSDKEKAWATLTAVYNKVQGTDVGLLVLDEILPAVDMGLLSLECLELILGACKDRGTDVLMTGRIRSCSLRSIVKQLSDICTDAYCVKHHFDTLCNKCGTSFKHHYTYCPDCGQLLEPSSNAKKGRDL